MLNFDPNAPLAGKIRILENAIAVPWGTGEKRGIARPCGIFTQDGAYCEEAALYRHSTAPTSVKPALPSEDEIEDFLPGTYLFGGLAYGHFGHALCESTARLWAVDHVDTHIDHILFFPKKRITWPNRTLSQTKTIVNNFGDMPTCIAINEPTRIERLIVPPQGFGVNNMIAGCPEFRDFTRKRLHENGAAKGPEKLYISRRNVFSKRGRLILESRVEAHMRAEGYEIFHPQENDFNTQLEHYRAAKFIVSTDNSALHLAAFVASNDCKIGIIVRRPSKIFRDFVTHFTNFSQITPTIVNACQRFWFRSGEAIKKNEVMTLLDFETTGQSLAAAGLISNGNWSNPTAEEVDHAIERFQEQAGLQYDEIIK